MLIDVIMYLSSRRDKEIVAAVPPLGETNYLHYYGYVIGYVDGDGMERRCLRSFIDVC